MKRVILLVGIILSVSSSYAETLNDVLVSDAYNKVYGDTMRLQGRREKLSPENNWMRGIAPGSNFGLLFDKAVGPKYLSRWANLPYTTFKLREEKAERRPDMARSISDLRAKNGAWVQVIIMAPHPTYYPMVELGVLKEFTSLEPPQLPVSYQETLQINGHEVKLYHTKHLGCSMLAKLPRHSLVSVYVPNCDNSYLMTDLIRQLDLDRLEKKLTT